MPDSAASSASDSRGTPSAPDSAAAPPSTITWRPDILGAGYFAAEMTLAEDEEGPNCATLVRYRPRRWRWLERKTVVLYMHGWNDYFFQRELAEFWHEQGAAFYAIDLRKYGRSLREHQTPGFITDLADYDEEIKLALAAIRQRHGEDARIVGMGHSTGGLVLSLWTAHHPKNFSALILNSPWLELQGSAFLRTLATPMISQLAKLNPKAELPNIDPGFSARTMLAEFGGEWEYNRQWRPTPMFEVRAGWLKAIMAGHAAVANGLDIDVPILAMSSAKSHIRPRWSEEMRSADIVLDANLIAERALALGPRVTVIRVAGGLHDLVMSRPKVRAWVYDEIARWSRAYVW